MADVQDLEARVSQIEARNRSVEVAKAWETSWTRRLAIAALTYVVASCYLLVIDNDAPLINAVVPTGGYLLSTLAMRLVRGTWESGIGE